MPDETLEALVRRLTTLVVKLDARDDQILEMLQEQREFTRQQVQINDRLTAAIERLDVTLVVIQALLVRGNGH
jgi:ABC-type transporter Mla subunit MlaD